MASSGKKTLPKYRLTLDTLNPDHILYRFKEVLEGKVIVGVSRKDPEVVRGTLYISPALFTEQVRLHGEDSGVLSTFRRILVPPNCFVQVA